MGRDSLTRGTHRRLLVVNPNGNSVVSDLVRAAADRAIGPGISAHVVHPADSPHSIETRADRAAAEPLALALIAANPDYDAYVMACFDDIALMEVRRMVRAPVVSAFEASIALARTMSDRIAILTTVEAAVPGIEALLARYGAADICSVRAAAVGVAEAAHGDPRTEHRIADTVAEVTRRARAGAVILGSAGLSGRANGLSATLGLPVIDSVEAAIRLASAASFSAGCRPVPRPTDSPPSART